MSPVNSKYMEIQNIKDFNEFIGEKKDKKPYELNIINLKEFRELKLPKAGSLIEKFLPEIGLTMIHGSPGSFKTYFALQMVFSIVNEELFLGSFKTKRVKVLIVNLDDIPVQFQDRFNFLNISDSDAPDINIIYDKEICFDVNINEHLEKMIAEANNLGVGLIVIDTLRQCHNQNENDSGEMKPTMNNLKKLSIATNSAVIFCHHDSKSTFGLSGAMKASGSHVIAGSTVSSIGLQENKDETIVLKIDRFKIGEKIKDKMTLKFSTKSYPLFTTVENKREKITDADAKEYILNFYTDNPSPGLSKGELFNQYASIWKIDKGKLSRAYETLVDEGILTLVTREDGKKNANNKKVYRLSETNTNQPNYSGP